MIRVCDAAVLVHDARFHAAAFDDRKNIQRQPFTGKQSEKARQLRDAGAIVVAFVTMIMIVILRKRRQLWPQIVELRRWPVELKLEAAELNMPRLLRQHNFQKVKIIS